MMDYNEYISSRGIQFLVALTIFSFGSLSDISHLWTFAFCEVWKTELYIFQ